MMNWLPRIVARAPFTVYTKLNGAFLAIVAILLTFGTLGLVVLNESKRRTEDFVKLQRKIAAYRQLQHDTTAQLYSITTALLSPDENLLASALRQLHQFRYDLDRVEYVSKDELEIFKKIHAEHEKLIQVVTQVVELTRAGKVSEAQVLRHRQANPVADQLERYTNEIVNRAESDIVAKIDQSHRAYLLSQRMVVGFALASIALALLLGYAISRSLMLPVMRMDAQMAKIASGDFSQRVHVPNRDELGALAEHLNRMSQELKRLYQQLEMASQHKSDFLANVSHELRTPLNAIIGYSEMLMEDGENTEQHAFTADLQKIHLSGKHLLALINDILDLSKIEAGKLDLFPEAFDVREMIMNVVNTVRPLAEKNTNSLEVHCADDLGTMYSDLTRLRQMLFNLLSNACKFTEGGVVTLRAERAAAEEESWLTVSVGDTGIGMTEEQMARIFEPFSQAEANISSRYGGTGLGLAITRQFCQMMGGDISVKSTYRVGSVFTMRLPMQLNGMEFISAG